MMSQSLTSCELHSVDVILTYGGRFCVRKQTRSLSKIYSCNAMQLKYTVRLTVPPSQHSEAHCCNNRTLSLWPSQSQLLTLVVAPGCSSIASALSEKITMLLTWQRILDIWSDILQQSDYWLTRKNTFLDYLLHRLIDALIFSISHQTLQSTDSTYLMPVSVSVNPLRRPDLTLCAFCAARLNCCANFSQFKAAVYILEIKQIQ